MLDLAPQNSGHNLLVAALRFFVCIKVQQGGANPPPRCQSNRNGSGGVHVCKDLRRITCVLPSRVPKMSDCNDEVFAAEGATLTSDGIVRFEWCCDLCGHKFETAEKDDVRVLGQRKNPEPESTVN